MSGGVRDVVVIGSGPAGYTAALWKSSQSVRLRWQMRVQAMLVKTRK